MTWAIADHDPCGRAGRIDSRRAQPNRGRLGRACVRPCRRNRSRRIWILVSRARRPSRQRGRIHRGGARPLTGRPCGEGESGRADRHQPRPGGLAGDPLSHRRRRCRRRTIVCVRADVPDAARRHRRANRRPHGAPGRQRVSIRRRSNRPNTSKSTSSAWSARATGRWRSSPSRSKRLTPSRSACAVAVRERLGVRIATRAVAPGSLPRWELKARRLVDRR